MLLQLLTELMNFTKMLITRILHFLKEKKTFISEKNKKQMYIMWKVPSSNKMAANYFVPPVNFCVCSPKLQNIKKSK